MAVRTLVRRYGDVLLGTTLAAAMSVELLVGSDANPLLSLPCAVFAGLGLSLRRRLPLAAFLLTQAGLFGLGRVEPGWPDESTAFMVVFLVALYSLGAHASGKEMWLGALVILIEVVAFVVGDGEPTDLSDVLFGIGFVGGPWAAGLAIKLRRDRERTLTAEKRELEQAQAETARLAVAAERARIARELHDVVSHAISVTVLQARGARKMLGTDEAEVRRSLDAIEHTNTQALGDMCRLLFLLRDTEDANQTDPQPSLARLDSLVDQLRDSGLPIELEITGGSEEVPPGVDLSAYRIIQEALTNVIKHAGPSVRATVSVTYGADDLAISVADDGGLGVNGDGRGHGLIGIRERVAVVGGSVEAGPGQSGGFVVRAHLPYTVET